MSVCRLLFAGGIDAAIRAPHKVVTITVRLCFLRFLDVGFIPSGLGTAQKRKSCFML